MLSAATGDGHIMADSSVIRITGETGGNTFPSASTFLLSILDSLSPLFADQVFARRLLFPIRPHVEMATARTTLRAHDLISERRHFNVVVSKLNNSDKN